MDSEEISKEESDRLLQLLGLILDECTAEILQYTVQLYEVSGEVDDYHPDQVAYNEPVASSVLLEVQESYF